MTPKELAIIAAKALDEKKGKEISAIEVTEQTSLADYFVFATGSSNTQINALCGSVEKAMHEQAGATPAPGGLPGRYVGPAGLRLRGGPRVLAGGPGILFPGAPVAGRHAPGSERRANGGLRARSWKGMWAFEKRSERLLRLSLPFVIAL